jgi:hypothetical protein
MSARAAMTVQGRPHRARSGVSPRNHAIAAADDALNLAVKERRVLLQDGFLTSAAYCAACWKIIAVRKEAAHRIDRDYPLPDAEESL